jgi:hypothetical protein
MRELMGLATRMGASDASCCKADIIQDGARAAPAPLLALLTLSATEHRVRPDRESHFQGVVPIENPTGVPC